MNIRELALITFTILGQMASGAMLVLMIIRSYLALKAKAEEIDGMLNGPLFIVVPIMGLALLASLLHLNNLVNIVHATPNLDSSWLSWEVVLSVTFMGLAVIYTFIQWRKLGGTTLRTIIGWVTAIVGVSQTYAMGMVYMVRTQPAWNTPATPITFFATSLLLGALAVAAALVVNFSINQRKAANVADKQLTLLRDVLQGISISAIILLGIEFLVMPIYMAYLSTQGSAALESLQMMTGTYGTTVVIRLLFVFVGAGLLATYLYRNVSSAGKERVMATLLYSAFVLVLVGEVLGRFLFYATHVRIGL